MASTGIGHDPDTDDEGGSMEVQKTTVLDFIEDRGDTGRLEEAREILPDTVDTDRDAALLASLGVDADDLDDEPGPGLSAS
jgi:hypothetical protein